MPLPHRFDEWDPVFKTCPSRAAEEEELLAEGFSVEEIPAVIERRNEYRRIYRKAMASKRYYQSKAKAQKLPAVKLNVEPNRTIASRTRFYTVYGTEFEEFEDDALTVLDSRSVAVSLKDSAPEEGWLSNMSDAIEEIINTTVTGKPLPTSRRGLSSLSVFGDFDQHPFNYQAATRIVCHWCFENGIDCTWKRLKPKRGRKRYRKGLNVFQISTADKSSDGQTNNEVNPSAPTPPLEYPASPLSFTGPLEIVPAEEENTGHSQFVQCPPAFSSSPNSAASDSSTSLELPTYEYNISSTASQNFAPDAEIVPAEEENTGHSPIVQCPPAFSSTPNSAASDCSTSLELPTYEYNISSTASQNFAPDAVLFQEDSQVHHLSVHVLNMRLATQFPVPYAMESQDLNGQYVYDYEVVPTTPQNIQEDAVETNFLFCPVPRKPFVKELRALIVQHGATSPQEQFLQKSLTPSLLQRPRVDVFRRSRSTPFKSYDADYTSTSGSFIPNSKADGPYPEAGPPLQTHENDTPATAYYYTFSESVPVDFVTDRYLDYFDYCNHIFATPNLNF
ncbi:hypothetical protein K435DRAFT_794192 [Dendrothele bispora CBS 962.96]|uniref:Uncharacterized protein n=1 Tax=Dendrothele bispora (strain CBS 962.96) TaxID=1314807 RepID=A0A4S8MCW7_DENBC|nr:hypothetical protein K435DRAFT_794192 [Dendrothele bispora CBS 962.96]